MSGNVKTLTPPPIAKMLMENREQIDKFVAGDTQALVAPGGEVGSTTAPPRAVGESGLAPRIVDSGSLPWRDSKVSSKHKQLMTVRVPEDEYLMARFLGETTYGESIQLIALRGLRQEIKRMMRERGIEVTQDSTGKLIAP